MKNKNIRNFLLLLIVSLLFVGLPTLLSAVGALSAYTAGVISLAGINAIMAISVNIISGITGQLSLGQAGFMALGGYATIIFTNVCHIPLPISMILAALITAVFGFLIGFPTLKLEGDYLAIVTLAFGEIIRVVLVNLKSVTGGPNGYTFPTVLTLNPTVAVLSISVLLVTNPKLHPVFLRKSDSCRKGRRNCRPFFGNPCFQVQNGRLCDCFFCGRTRRLSLRHVCRLHKTGPSIICKIRGLPNICGSRRHGFNDRKRSCLIRADLRSGMAQILAELPTPSISCRIDNRDAFQTARTFGNKRIFFRKDIRMALFRRNKNRNSKSEESHCGT